MTDRIDPAFGHWFAGFADGEGSFLISKYAKNRTMFCSFRIALHHHDEAILREIAYRTGLGRVTVQFSPSQAAPRAQWTVARKAECLRLVEIFETFPLRAKKSRDFEIWARAIREWQAIRAINGTGMPNDYSTLNALRHELRLGRPNRGPKVVVA